MLRLLVRFFHAQYQYHLHGMLRKPFRMGLLSTFTHKIAGFYYLNCISICYKKLFKLTISINSNK
ncbi:hypothetical protein HMPREF0880_00189 [Yokenella regensburgei ATCC 43003]|nr:hypothetical protein HMPREF0880_00189 [Yokenella regensburgei ATCC 43003]